MANKKNNINELVTDDDDPTAELEVLALEQVSTEHAVDLESDANTCDYTENQSEPDREIISELMVDLNDRSETIDRLQFDIEQLRARWLGLETEIGAREEITARLNRELEDAKNSSTRLQEQLKKRDQKIKSLKAEIRERDSDYRSLTSSNSSLQTQLDVALATEQELRSAVIKATEQSADLESRLSELAAKRDSERRSNTEAQDDADREAMAQRLFEQEGRLAGNAATIQELANKLERTEEYADTMRRQLHDLILQHDASNTIQEDLQKSLNLAMLQLAEHTAALESEKQTAALLKLRLDELDDAHALEVRTIRFELGQAEETLAQTELLSEQLVSDLVDTREVKIGLETMLSEKEQDSQKEIESLRKRVQKLEREIVANKQKIETKSQAVTCLLAELAKKDQQLESIDRIEDVIHEIDDRMSERIEERPAVERDRMTRVLIGTFDGQELRFPLFKNRLTIGRTQQNDIQLDAAFISRRHAVIVTDGSATRIIDWGSKNGVSVNSNRVTEHFLKNGDVVTIGTADFKYEERPKRDN